MYGDKAYNDYAYEDRLVPRKTNSSATHQKKEFQARGRQFFGKDTKEKRTAIETMFSCIEKLMPRSIHAVTKAVLN